MRFVIKDSIALEHLLKCRKLTKAPLVCMKQGGKIRVKLHDFGISHFIHGGEQEQQTLKIVKQGRVRSSKDLYILFCFVRRLIDKFWFVDDAIDKCEQNNQRRFNADELYTSMGSSRLVQPKTALLPLN